MKKLLSLILTFLIGGAVILSNAGAAQAGFDQNKVIDDEAFINSGSLSAPAIQSFLESRGSTLSGFSEGGKTAAKIIYDAAQANGINPQVLLATLQKEQGLLSLGTSYDPVADKSNRMKTAMGYGCPDSGGCDARYAGFTNQVEGAAFQFRFNYDGSANRKFSNYQIDQTMTFDGTAIYLTNKATASLYRYTPHISGNLSFYNTFFTYFLAYSSHISSQNGYPTLAPGDSYKYSLKFQNIGNKAWDRSVVKLGTDYPKDRISRFLLENRTGNGEPTQWSSSNRIGMTESSVATNATGSFDFYMTVPASLTPGVYKEYFRPIAEGVQWLDDEKVYWNVTVANHSAKWAGQNFGAKTFEPGQSFMMEVKLENDGQTTWRNNGETPVRLGTSRQADRLSIFTREDVASGNPSGWATPNRVAMVEPTVAPGQSGTFRFWYTVPASVKAGVYREYFQPVHENVRQMNDLGIYFDITVATQKAVYVSQSSYPSLAKGESTQFTVKFLNTGDTAWTKTGATPMRLGTMRPNDRTPAFIRDDAVTRNTSGWVNPNRISMVENSVAPGQVGTFSFWYTIPGDKAAGTYREYFGLVQDYFAFLPDTAGVYWDVTVK